MTKQPIIMQLEENPDLYRVESNGKVYIVDTAKKSCTCLGYWFKKRCYHLQLVLNLKPMEMRYHGIDRNSDWERRWRLQSEKL